MLESTKETKWLFIWIISQLMRSRQQRIASSIGGLDAHKAEGASGAPSNLGSGDIPGIPNQASTMSQAESSVAGLHIEAARQSQRRGPMGIDELIN
ncbi:hypothetical protein TWF730_000564 [Orbilia blumenaviensis]|uniref:Uncharacterized protein n=1 Tax=Orbilia blumenaviensis TaxID=1796055 RepID=A0AAV9VM94_9PEZI